MTESSQPRSVKIGSDERTGWSSDRRRPDGGPARAPNFSVRCRVLRPSDRLRYSPGSLLMVVSASHADRDRLIERVVEAQNAVLSLSKVRTMLAGRVAADQVESHAQQLLEAAVGKRLGAEQSVVIAADGLDAAEREAFVALAARARRPRHLILLETANDEVRDEDRMTLNALRSALDGGELGAEGFNTALRLSRGSASEVKRIVFRPEPRDD